MTTDRIGVSVADLAAALEGFEAGFTLADGTNVAGKLLYPKIIAGRLWQVLGEMGLPAPGTRTPRFASDLQAAIARLGEVIISLDRYDTTTREATGRILYPGTVAGRILQAIGLQEPDGEVRLEPGDMPSRFEDPEVDAIAAIVDRLAVLECETDAGTVRRVARYLAARYAGGWR